MQSKSADEEIIEKIQEELKRIPSLLNNDSYEFQDKHMMMQTYLMSRMLEEIEGIHNGFFVLYNEKQSDQKQPSDTSNAMELIDWRLGGIKETFQVLERQLDGLLRQPAPGKDMLFWLEKFSKKGGET